MVRRVCLDGVPSNMGSIPERDKRFFSTPVSSHALETTRPPIQWVQGCLSPGVKRQRLEADHSPPSSAEANGGAIIPLPRTSLWSDA
jgi:hypothetical protein